jgi:hypothetical protein
VSITSILRACATDLLDTEPTITVEQVVGCAYRRHGDDFAAESERLVLASATSIVRELLRDLADDEDDAQLSLPGMAFPSAICVQTPDGTYYVRTDKATWPELLAGRDVRATNVDRAAAKLAIYDASLEKLREVMEADETLTVADAIEKLAVSS